MLEFISLFQGCLFLIHFHIFEEVAYFVCCSTAIPRFMRICFTRFYFYAIFAYAVNISKNLFYANYYRSYVVLVLCDFEFLRNASFA